MAEPGFGRWVRATWAGWVLGIPLIVALALMGEAIGIGGVQVLVGAGMGMGIGLMQARALRGVLPKTAPWFWSCVVGLGLPFLAADVAQAAGLEVAYSLPACVALGGLIVGVWQALLLRRRYCGTRWWVVASAVGWILAAGVAGIADSLTRSRSLRGLGGAAAYLGLVAGGGLVLGLVTGLPWARMRGREPGS